MRGLIIVLFIIALIYTVTALAIAWWEVESKVPFRAMLPLILYFVPVGALWVACLALLKVTGRPQV